MRHRVEESFLITHKEVNLGAIDADGSHVVGGEEPVLKAGLKVHVYRQR